MVSRLEKQKRRCAASSKFRQIDFLDDITVTGRQKDFPLFGHCRNHVAFHVAAAANNPGVGVYLVHNPRASRDRMWALMRDRFRSGPSANGPARPVKKMGIGP